MGVVSDRYKVVQNVDAFSFTDELLGKGVRYETAGSLQEGKKVWLLARLPRRRMMFLLCIGVGSFSMGNSNSIYSFTCASVPNTEKRKKMVGLFQIQPSLLSRMWERIKIQ